jgi:methionyl aminopeptidase
MNVRLQPGMTITYEPMYCLGSGETMELADGWSVITKDHSLAAHWEHTILITDGAAEALTI